MPAPDKLYIVTSIFNPEGYRSRYKLYYQFAEYIQQFPNAELWTVELAFAGQDFAVTNADCPQHIQLRTDKPLWYKENLLNIGISRLPTDARFIAWIDADVHFEETTWVEDTIEKLKEHPFVQMFRQAKDLGPNGEIVSQDRSFVHRWLTGDYTEKKRGRSGLAWAATREALTSVGGLIDWGIVGSGDWFMAFALTEQITDSNLSTKSGGYSRDAIMLWANRCQQYIKKNLGYVDLTVYHNWHGKKINRGYNTRWLILSENQFNPLTDLEYAENRLIQLGADKPKLLADIKEYFHSRNEDDEEK